MYYVFIFFGAFQLGSVFHDIQSNSVAGDSAVALGIGALLLFLSWRGFRKQKVASSVNQNAGRNSESKDETEPTILEGDGITFTENGVRFL